MAGNLDSNSDPFWGLKFHRKKAGGNSEFSIAPPMGHSHEIPQNTFKDLNIKYTFFFL